MGGVRLRPPSAQPPTSEDGERPEAPPIGSFPCPDEFALRDDCRAPLYAQVAPTSLGRTQAAERLQLSKLIGKEAPAAALGGRVVLDGCPAFDAANEPVEHPQRGGAAQAVGTGKDCRGWADRPALLAHARFVGVPPAAVAARRRASSLQIPAGVSHPPSWLSLRDGTRARQRDDRKTPRARGCQEHPLCGNLVGERTARGVLPPCPAP